MTIDAECPVCEEWFALSNPVRVNRVIACPHCLSDLKVISIEPVELELIELISSLAVGNTRGTKKGKKNKRTRRPGDDFGGEDDFLAPPQKSKDREKRRKEWVD